MDYFRSGSPLSTVYMTTITSSPGALSANILGETHATLGVLSTDYLTTITPSHGMVTTNIIGNTHIGIGALSGVFDTTTTPSHGLGTTSIIGNTHAGIGALSGAFSTTVAPSHGTVTASFMGDTRPAVGTLHGAVNTTISPSHSMITSNFTGDTHISALSGAFSGVAITPSYGNVTANFMGSAHIGVMSGAFNAATITASHGDVTTNFIRETGVTIGALSAALAPPLAIATVNITGSARVGISDNMYAPLEMFGGADFGILSRVVVAPLVFAPQTIRKVWFSFLRGVARLGASIARCVASTRWTPQWLRGGVHAAVSGRHRPHSRQSLAFRYESHTHCRILAFAQLNGNPPPRGVVVHLARKAERTTVYTTANWRGTYATIHQYACRTGSSVRIRERRAEIHRTHSAATNATINRRARMAGHSNGQSYLPVGESAGQLRVAGTRQVVRDVRMERGLWGSEDRNRTALARRAA